MAATGSNSGVVRSETASGVESILRARAAAHLPKSRFHTPTVPPLNCVRRPVGVRPRGVNIAGSAARAARRRHLAPVRAAGESSCARAAM